MTDPIPRADGRILALHGVKRLLEAAGRAAMVGYGLWQAARGPASALPPPDAVRRLLVIRLDLLGDVVFSLPAVEALQRAFPRARVDLLVLPYTAPIVAQLPGIGRIHSLDVNQFRRPSGIAALPSLVWIIRTLRRQRYDVAVGLHGVTGGLFAAASGARWRIGYAEEAYWGCYNAPLPGRRYRRPRHEVEYCLDLVRGMGVEASIGWPVLPRAADGSSLVAGRGVDGRFAVIVPGASNGAAKRWPAEYWAKLGDRLARDRSLRVVISGAGSERSLAAAVAQEMDKPCVDLAGETSVADLVRLLAQADVVVAGDTGPLHVAAALGRPVVGIFGPTDPTNTGPLAKTVAVVRLGLGCSPCYDLTSPAECKLPDRSVACMWGLTPDRVYAEVCRVLDEGVDER